MRDVHVDELLIAHARGELEGSERMAVDAHLAGCDRCAASLRAYSRLLAELQRTPPPAAPPIQWTAYQAELRDKLARRAARGEDRWPWLLRPLPAALAAGLVAALLYVGIPGPTHRGRSLDEPATLEHSILASRLDMIHRLDLVQRLDLLEDFDVIRGLDRLPADGEG
jgi:anti-sigma factor RsiW